MAMDPSDSSESKIILVSSFLAGILLTKKVVTSYEICEYMKNFTVKHWDCYFDEPFDDFSKLSKFVCFDGNVMYLNEDNYIVNNYLYDLTNTEIREFFGIEEKDDTKVYIDEIKNVKKKSIFNVMKRTKVYTGS